MATQTVPDVGAGTTITFATSNISISCTVIAIGSASTTIHDTTHLGTTVAVAGDINTRTKLAGQHVALDGINITFHWDWDIYTALRVSQTITITDPDGNAISGTGILSEVSGASYDVDGLLVGSGKIETSGRWYAPTGT